MKHTYDKVNVVFNVVFWVWIPILLGYIAYLVWERYQ